MTNKMLGKSLLIDGASLALRVMAAGESYVIVSITINGKSAGTTTMGVFDFARLYSNAEEEDATPAVCPECVDSPMLNVG